jgi:hypothetical protein
MACGTQVCSNRYHGDKGFADPFRWAVVCGFALRFPVRRKILWRVFAPGASSRAAVLTVQRPNLLYSTLIAGDSDCGFIYARKRNRETPHISSKEIHRALEERAELEGKGLLVPAREGVEHVEETRPAGDGDLRRP